MPTPEEIAAKEAAIAAAEREAERKRITEARSAAKRARLEAGLPVEFIGPVPEPTPPPAAPVTPPEELVAAEAEARKMFEKPLPPRIVRGPPPPVAMVEPAPTPIRILTPREVEAGIVPTVLERAAVGEISQAELERRLEAAKRERRAREFFEKGGVERLAELHEVAEKETKEAEQAAEALRQLAIPFVGAEEVEPKELRRARVRLERVFEGVDIERPVSPAKFAEIREAQRVFAEEFGKAFKISPTELESRIARAEAGGLFEAFTKEQREAIEAQAALVEFGGEFLRAPTETEREFFMRIRPTVEDVAVDPELAKVLGVGEVSPEARRARREFLAGVKVGIRPPEETFAGKVFRATVEAEAKLGREIGPAVAAIGGIGARILGTFEETTRFIGEITGTRPRRPVIPPPTIISPFVGVSPLEALVHPGRRFISGLAAGAVFFPLETKAFSAGIRVAVRGAVSGAGSITRGIGDVTLFKLAKADVLKITQRKVIRLPLGERGAVVGEIGRRIKPLKIQTLVGKERGPGIVAERFLDRLEAAQIAHPRLTAPLRPFFGKPTIVELAEARRLTATVAGRISRGGVRATEQVRVEFARTGIKVSERQFRKIQEFLRALDPETAAITGVKRARGIVGITEIQFKGLGRRPAQNILRLLSGEKGAVKRIAIGEIEAKRTTSQLLRQMQFRFRAPGVRGRISRFFRPTEQRRFFRRVLGERGAEIGEPIRPRAPIGVKRVTLTKLEPTLDVGAPEIVERATFRRFLETVGIQRRAPGEFRELSVIERLRISAQPSPEIEKIFKVIPAKKVGVMKPFDLRKALDIRPAEVRPGAPPAEVGVGRLRTLLDVPEKIVERGRISLRLITGVTVKGKPIVGPRILRLLRAGEAAAVVTAVKPRATPTQRQIRSVVSGEATRAQEIVRVREKPIAIERPVETQIATQQQGLRVKQAVQLALKQALVAPAAPIAIGEFGAPAFRAFALPPGLEEDKVFKISPVLKRRVVQKERVFPVADILKLFEAPIIDRPRARRKGKEIRAPEIKIPEIKLPFSDG